mgnify:CR=1 FL=1
MHVGTNNKVTSTDSDSEIAFYINGSRTVTDAGAAYSRKKGFTGFCPLVLMSTLWMDAGDTIGVRVVIASVHYNSEAVSYFGGHKIA